MEHVVWISSHKTRDAGPSLFLWQERFTVTFVLRTFPASTISLSLHLCFFHVDSVDWLKLNCLHRSTAFTPQSNLPSISIFSLRVQSVCWHLAFESDILKCNAERKTQFYIISNAFIFHVERVERIDHRDIKQCTYFSKRCRRSWKKGKPLTIHERR